jgi:hypothetical protein
MRSLKMHAAVVGGRDERSGWVPMTARRCGWKSPPPPTTRAGRWHQRGVMSRPVQAPAILAAAAITCAIAVPSAAAQATPTLHADRPCYTPGEVMTLTGAGFTPGIAVGFFFQPMGAHGSNLLSGDMPATADVAGNFSTRYGAPKLASSDDLQEQLFITANEQTPAGQPLPPEGPPFGVAQLLLSTFDVLVAPWDRNQVDPRKTITVRAYGYEPATKLWAHYVLHGKRIKTVYVGALTGPCGNAVKHMREFPFRPVPAGTYSVYFQGSQTLNKRIGTPYRQVIVSRAKAIA